MAGQMRFKNASGFTGLLKEGYKHFGGLEEAILKNIEACKGLAAITRTSLGPNGAYLHPPHCATLSIILQPLRHMQSIQL